MDILLVHVGHGFTSNASSTLEVCLVFSEVDSASRKCTLLQNPSALVQRAFNDIFAEVVDRFAHVEWLFAMSLEHYIVTLWARFQEPISLTVGSAGGNDAHCSTVYIFHVLGFHVKVTILALKDAEGVDPQVAHAELTGTSYSIFEGCRKLVLGNGLFEMGKVPSCTSFIDWQSTKGLVWLDVTPSVRQRDVRAAQQRITGAFDEPEYRFFFNANINETSWELDRAARLTFVVARAMSTVFQPAVQNSEECVTSRFR